MCDSDGMLIEATQSNLFWISDGVLYTPDLSLSGIDGIMRKLTLMTAAKKGIKTEIVRRGPDVLKTADEVFITNSLIGIMPVTKYENYLYSIGKTTQLLQTLTENI